MAWLFVSRYLFKKKLCFIRCFILLSEFWTYKNLSEKNGHEGDF